MLYACEFWKSALQNPHKSSLGKTRSLVLGMEVEETCHQNVCTHVLRAVVFFNLLRPIGGGFNLENWLHLAKEPWTVQNSNLTSWGIIPRQSQIKAT